MRTPLDALVEAITAAAVYNPAIDAAPEAVLWCDEQREFAPLMPAVRGRMPQVMTLGPPDSETRSGPALWLRAAATGAVEGIALPPSTIPVLWLPGVARETLRAAEECPNELVPLAWLASAGSFFGHVNGKDWTLGGFLGADRGPLKLDVASDGPTRYALAQAAAELFSRPIASLNNRHIDEPFLLDLIMPEPEADMLRWLDGRLDQGRLVTLVKWAKKTLDFDIAKNDRGAGAALLARRQGAWGELWSRFDQNPGFHEPLIELLGGLSPDLGSDGRAYPKINADKEAELRRELAKIDGANANDARIAVLNLEKTHGWRRETIWARLGKAPLAIALGHIATVAAASSLPLHDPRELAAQYAEAGWRIDSAALDALAAVPRTEDRDAVSAALRAVYQPWLHEAATALQSLASGIDFSTPPKPGRADAVLFVDGLRMDLGHRLAAILQAEGAAADVNWRWSGFPTVTATCKPFASPVAAAFAGNEPIPGFQPTDTDGKPVTQAVLKKALQSGGWATDADFIPEGKVWQEAGTFDSDGHALGIRLVDGLPNALQVVADTALRLARSGHRLRITTDHGWLLLPGGLETAKIESGMTEPNTKWSRCAVVKPGASVSVPQVRWTWNSDTWVATAPGVAVFYGGVSYAHGGISPQECVLPEILLEPLASPLATMILEATWKALRLSVRVENGVGLTVDLRKDSVSGPSIAAAAKEIETDGLASVLVKYDDRGADCVLVVLDGETVLARMPLKVPN